MSDEDQILSRTEVLPPAASEGLAKRLAKVARSRWLRRVWLFRLALRLELAKAQ